jgi:RNA ligase
MRWPNYKGDWKIMHIDDLVRAEERELALETGHLAAKTSPDGTKILYCYTPQAQFQRVWNSATTRLRGVTVDAETGEILARPFSKFFNYGDKNAPEVDMSQHVFAFDKIDGSLAVLQPDGTMTSKGSFTSDQAIAATRLYKEKYEGKWAPREGYTYCFEYTAPDNRIVLDYGPEPELTLLGIVANHDGFIYFPRDRIFGWNGPVAKPLFENVPFSEVLEAEPRENAEGMVIVWGVDNVLKLKQADYLAMHAIVTNTNARTVWEAMAVNDCIAHGSTPEQLKRDLQLGPDKIERAMELGEGWLEKLSEGVPDEFHEWLHKTAEDIYEGDYQNALRSAKSRQNPQYLERIYGIKDPSRGKMARHLQATHGDSELPWNISLDIWLNDGMLTTRSRTGLWRHIRPGHSTWGPTANEEIE